MKNYMIAILSALIALPTLAAAPALQDIKEEDFNKITKEFAANFVHTTVTPPNSLGALFGFEVGIIGGVTRAKNIETISKSISSSSNLKYLPHAGIMGQVTIPFGISFEGSFFPEKKFGDVTINSMSMAAKWNLTDSILPIPFIDIATRFHFGSGEVSYATSDSVSDVPVNSKVSVESSSYGVNASVGANLLLFRPYIGAGYVWTDNTMKVNASSGTIFDTSFTSSKEAKKKHSGSHLFAGGQLSILLLKLGVEYSKVIDVTKYSMKLSLAF